MGLVFDTGLSVTLLMGHLGCLANRRSVPVVDQLCCSMVKRPKADVGSLLGEGQIDLLGDMDC